MEDSTAPHRCVSPFSVRMELCIKMYVCVASIHVGVGALALPLPLVVDREVAVTPC